MECLLHETRQAFISFEMIQDNVVYLRYKRTMDDQEIQTNTDQDRYTYHYND